MIIHINRLKDKHHRTILLLLDQEKTFNNIQLALHGKVLEKLQTQWTYFNAINRIYSKSIVNIFLKGEKLKVGQLKSESI